MPPSGILGPFGGTGNYLVQLVNDYIMGRLPACVKGGYDFVDVRDVAQGCLLAADKGRKGECYILSNRHYEIREVLAMVHRLCSCRRWQKRPPLFWQAMRNAGKSGRCTPDILFIRYGATTVFPMIRLQKSLGIVLGI